MTHWMSTHRVLAGWLLGLSDALFRAIAALAWEPSDGRLVGPLIFGNVHHPVGIRGLGLSTMQWFGIAALLLCAFYALVRWCSYRTGRDYPGFGIARAMLAAIAGVLVLNVIEAATTGKVTDYIGLVDGSRAHVANFGDIVVTFAGIGLFFAIMSGLLDYLRDPQRVR